MKTLREIFTELLMKHGNSLIQVLILTLAIKAPFSDHMELYP